MKRGNWLFWARPLETTTQVLVNDYTTAFMVDLLFILSTIFVWMYREAREYDIPRVWLYYVLTLLFGLAGSLPLFLYVREVHKERIQPRTQDNTQPEERPTMLYPYLVFPVLIALAFGCDSQNPEGGTFLPVQSGEEILAAELDLPSGAGPHPAMVMVHGSGKDTRETFAGAARHYASLGVATLRYDKRGTGQSTGRFQGVNAKNSTAMFDILARDVLAAVSYLRQHPQIDPEQIGLIGVSQGGWIIPLATSRSSNVAFMINVSGAASSVGISDYYDGIAEQGLSEGEIAAALQAFDGIHGFDPAPYLERVRIPGLWIYGGQDKKQSDRERPRHPGADQNRTRERFYGLSLRKCRPRFERCRLRAARPG